MDKYYVHSYKQKPLDSGRVHARLWDKYSDKIVTADRDFDDIGADLSECITAAIQAGLASTWDVVAVFRRYDEADALCCELNDRYHAEYKATHDGWSDARPKYFVTLVEE